MAGARARRQAGTVEGWLAEEIARRDAATADALRAEITRREASRTWLADEIARRDAATAAALREEVARRAQRARAAEAPEPGVRSHVSGLALRLAEAEAETAEEQARESARS